MLIAGGEMERAGVRMVGMKGRKCKLWWFGKGDEVGGDGGAVLKGGRSKKGR